MQFIVLVGGIDGGFTEIATLRLRLSICAGIEVSGRIDNDDQQRERCSNAITWRFRRCVPKFIASAENL